MRLLRDAWLAPWMGMLLWGAVIGVVGYAGPNWRKWVKRDVEDQRIEGKPVTAEYTTGYRLRQIVFSLAAGLFFLGFMAWYYGR